MFFLLSFVFQSIEENCQIFLLSVFFLLWDKTQTFPSSLFRVATAQQILGSTQHTLSHTTADGRFALLRGAALAGVFVGKFDRVSTGLGTPHLQDLHPRSAGVSSITPEEHRTALGVTFRTLARPTSTHNRVGNLPQQSDVCDVTFPKNDCCSLSPYNTLACAHSFPFFLFFFGGPSFALSVPHWRRRRRRGRGHFGTSCRIWCRFFPTFILFSRLTNRSQ